MKRNTRKRITNIQLEPHQDAARIVFHLNGTSTLVVDAPGLSVLQAEVLTRGYACGLQSGGKLPPEFIEMLLNDPMEIAALQVPLSIPPAERALFKRGATAALQLAAEGYWLDLDKTVARPAASSLPNIYSPSALSAA